MQSYRAIMHRLSPDKSGSYVGCYGFAAWQDIKKISRPCHDASLRQEGG
jgi:hypothetical protein